MVCSKYNEVLDGALQVEVRMLLLEGVEVPWSESDGGGTRSDGGSRGSSRAAARRNST